MSRGKEGGQISEVLGWQHDLDTEVVLDCSTDHLL